MRRDVALAAEAGVDRHDQHQVDEVEHVLDGRRRRGRVQRDPRGDAELAHRAEHAMQVHDGLGVDDEAPAAGLDVAGGQQVGCEHHQVRLEGQRRVVAGGGDDVRPEREVGDELAVHHVPLDAVAAGRLERGDLLAEARQVGRQHGGGDLDRAAHRAQR